MENTLVKFITTNSRTTDSSHKHWEYCCTHKIPQILIINSGTKYWVIDYDLLPINKSASFTTSDFQEYLEPLYNLYCKYSKFKANKSSFGNFSFRVYKKDAIDIAEKLFDLIVILSQRD